MTRFRALRRDHEESVACKAEALPAGPRPCPRSRNSARDAPDLLLACSWLSPLRSGCRRRFTRRASRRESRWARPPRPERRRTERRSSTSAIQTIREHHHAIDRSSLCRASPSVRLRAALARACAREHSRAFAREGPASFRPREPEPPPGPRLSPGTRLLLREAPRWASLGSRFPTSSVETFVSSLGREWQPLRPLAGDVRDLATPSATVASPVLSHRRRAESAPRAPTEVSRARGRPLSLPASPTAVCPEAGTDRSFAPTRSARTPPVVVSPRQRRETRRRHQPEGTSDLARDPTEGRITRASAKKPEIRRTRGAFHR